MNRSIEIAALLLGGLSLFAVCFVGFAMMSGKPLSDLAVLGSIFDAGTPELGTPVTSEPPPEATGERRPTATKSDREVVHSSLGVLGTWTVPAPFSKDELKALAEELKARRLRLEQREAELARREGEAADAEARVQDRFEGLEALRSRLEAYELELAAREAEVARGLDARAARDERRWAQVAGLFDALEEDEASAALAEYSPEDAAQILRQLPAERAAEVLAGLRRSRAGDWKGYVDAYAAETPRQAPK